MYWGGLFLGSVHRISAWGAVCYPPRHSPSSHGWVLRRAASISARTNGRCSWVLCKSRAHTDLSKVALFGLLVEPWFHSWCRGRVETLDAKYNLAYINSTLCGHTSSSKRAVWKSYNPSITIDPIPIFTPGEDVGASSLSFDGEWRHGHMLSQTLPFTPEVCPEYTWEGE